MQQPGQIITCKHFPAVWVHTKDRQLSIFTNQRTVLPSKVAETSRKCSWGHNLWWNRGWEPWRGTFDLLGKIRMVGLVHCRNARGRSRWESPPRGDSTTGSHYRKVFPKVKLSIRHFLIKSKSKIMGQDCLTSLMKECKLNNSTASKRP